MTQQKTFVWGLFIVFLSFAATATASISDYAQSKKVTVVAQNKPLKEIFSIIEKQSEYIFLYADGVINPNQRVSLNLTNVTVDKVLDVVLSSTNTQYTINSNSRQITLSIKAASAVSSGLKKITGTVVDEQGESVIGANISIKGTTIGTITDLNGGFTLEAPLQSTLVITYIGYSTKEIIVTNQSDYKIAIAEDLLKLDEVVVVGYGTQKKESLTGSVSMVKGTELTKAPAANVSNMLAGRMPGLVSLQSGGAPGSDHPTMSIRGFGQAIYIVDGVEKDFTQIDPSQIESISILKDGAAAIYGSRAGNGVILVTTKRGIEQKPTVTLNASYTLQGNTMMPTPVSSGQYAEMARETWLNSGNPESTAPYTLEQIGKFYAGNDPQYPNTDWKEVAIKDFAPLQQHNLSIRGGNEAIRYFGSMGYMNQESMWKSGKGGGYERYNFQSNIDATITDALTMEISVSYILGQNLSSPRGQGAGINSVWQDYWNTLPTFPATLPDPNKLSWAEGSGLGGVHIVTNTDLKGYNRNTNQNLFGSGSIKYDFSKHGVQGLTAKGFFNYTKENNSGKVWTKNAKTYIYDTESDIYTMKSGEGAKPQISQSRNDSKTMTGQFSLNYDNTFGSHHIAGLALYEAISYQSEWLTAGRDNVMSETLQQIFAGDMKTMKNDGSETTMGRSSFVARLNYDYESRYLVEAIIRSDASAKFAAGSRTGWFPSVSLGWRLSNEKFMENLSFLDDLKLRLSYGNMGDDSVGNFQYLSGYKLSGSYLFGQNVVNGIETTGMANPWLTWKNIAVYNIGVDYSFFNRKLYGSLEGFYRKVTGIPAQNTASVSNTFGASLPIINLNETSNRGFDFTAGSAFQLDKVFFDLSANLSWTREKYDYYSEPTYTDLDQIRLNQLTGRWTNVTFGYKTAGLFTSQGEIDALDFDQDRQGNKTLRPGDIRFVDINGDKILDWKDQTELGLGTTPNWMFGLNINARYRDFDFSALFQGAFGFYKNVKVQHMNVSPEVVYNERWSESNNVSDALFPRLGGSSLNSQTSDYFFKPADYLRLKTLTVGYNLPAKFMTKARLQGCRIYFAANNLFTLSGLNKYGIDPESPSGMGGMYYPQQRTLSFGLNVSF